VTTKLEEYGAATTSIVSLRWALKTPSYLQRKHPEGR
jgi:hypothetical protein